MADIVPGDKILMEFSTFGDRFLSVVTDVKRDGRLLVYSPITEPILERLKTDTHAFVRFAHEGKLHGFNTRILNKVDSLQTILEIEKPGPVVDAEDRSEPRCSCRFPAIVVHGERAAQAVVEDMSPTCSRVRFLNGEFVARDASDAEPEVNLTFHPFDMGEGYSVGCVVRNEFIKEGSRYAVLEFDSRETDACERIARFVENQVCCGIPRL